MRVERQLLGGMRHVARHFGGRDLPRALAEILSLEVESATGFEAHLAGRQRARPGRAVDHAHRQLGSFDELLGEVVLARCFDALCGLLDVRLAAEMVEAEAAAARDRLGHDPLVHGEHVAQRLAHDARVG